jgi:Ser/Thr protein kinase RdoA (MazF antagonist)
MEEHRLLDFLTTRTPLVVPALRNGEGLSAIETTDWTYEVHPAAEGQDVYEEALSWTPFLHVGHARAAGRALGELHRAAEGYAALSRRVQPLVSSFSIFGGRLAPGAGDPVARMEAYLLTRPLLREYAEKRDWRGSFDALLLPLYDRLTPWLAGLTPLWTHNDFHASNLTWSDASDGACVKSVIDFGLADRTTAIHDLATAIERNIVEWLRVGEPVAEPAGLVHLEHLDALLAGYAEERTLNANEAQALVELLPLVHCEFALSETDYFLSVLGSEEKAALGYEGYFLAHARWFQGASGRRLLDHLQRWADSPAKVRGGER